MLGPKRRTASEWTAELQRRLEAGEPMTLDELAVAESLHSCQQVQLLASRLQEMIERIQRGVNRLERIDGRCERIERYILAHDPDYHGAIRRGLAVKVDPDDAPRLAAARPPVRKGA
jgi:hypothetical protein